MNLSAGSRLHFELLDLSFCHLKRMAYNLSLCCFFFFVCIIL